MLFIWKNKGLLVVLYLFASLAGTAMLAGILSRNVGGIFTNIHIEFTVAIAFLIAAIWTYLTRDSYYRDANGNKKNMEIRNEFFFISMKIWAYIFMAASVLFFILSAF